MKFGIGTHEEGNYVHAPVVEPSTINHQPLPRLQDRGSLHKHENFKKHCKPWVGTHKAKLIEQTD